MNKAVFMKIFSRCEDEQDIEMFQAVLMQKIYQLKRPEEEKSCLIQVLGEVAREFSRNIRI
jgi:hypothetical protein